MKRLLDPKIGSKICYVLVVAWDVRSITEITSDSHRFELKSASMRKHSRSMCIVDSSYSNTNRENYSVTKKQTIRVVQRFVPGISFSDCTSFG